ncbi:MAG: M42 family peptidase [Candidatus Sumerlaeia bacterium]|nr:M42 family peptidase [Candidatus Sumerlaeia bacterium]
MKIDATWFFDQLCALTPIHSPSGDEDRMSAHLEKIFAKAGREVHRDAADNLWVRIPGSKGGKPIAIVAHKDEIGTMVTRIEDDGRLRVRKLGGSYPWIYGEGPMDILGEKKTITGILSFGARHVSREYPNEKEWEKKPVTWPQAWVETLLTPEELAKAGVRPGTRVVLSSERKQPRRIGRDSVAGFALDNRIGLALLHAMTFDKKPPAGDVYLLASAREEIGGGGVNAFLRHTDIHTLVTVDIVPVAEEYPIEYSDAPVLLSADSHFIYDERLNRTLVELAGREKIPVQHAVVAGYSSDASIPYKMGLVPSAGGIVIPTKNSHGHEILPLGCLVNAWRLATALCRG